MWSPDMEAELADSSDKCGEQASDLVGECPSEQTKGSQMFH